MRSARADARPTTAFWLAHVLAALARRWRDRGSLALEVLAIAAGTTVRAMVETSAISAIAMRVCRWRAAGAGLELWRGRRGTGGKVGSKAGSLTGALG